MSPRMKGTRRMHYRRWYYLTALSKKVSAFTGSQLVSFQLYLAFLFSKWGTHTCVLQCQRSDLRSRISASPMEHSFPQELILQPVPSPLIVMKRTMRMLTSSFHSDLRARKGSVAWDRVLRQQASSFLLSGTGSNLGTYLHLSVISSNNLYWCYVACTLSSPGRFLAIAEIKAVLAYIILNYDFKLDGDEKQFPKSMHILTAIIPNTQAKLAFRKKPKSERFRITSIE